MSRGARGDLSEPQSSYPPSRYSQSYNLQAAVRAHHGNRQEVTWQTVNPSRKANYWMVYGFLCVFSPHFATSPLPPSPFCEVKGKVTSQGPRVNWEGGWQQEPAIITMATGP